MLEDINRLEIENNIRIILAVENGSRNWGLAGPKSDYDLRFVFCHPIKAYLRTHRPNEVLGGRFLAEWEDNIEVDYQGFDIYKFVELFEDSNPTVIEWLNSTIVYKEEPSELIDFTRRISNKRFNPMALFHHYRSMGWSNFSKYILRGNNVTYKRYLYAFRGLFNAIYVLLYDRLPDFDFRRALSETDFVDKELKDFYLNEVIPAKLNGLDKMEIDRLPRIDSALHTLFNEYERPELPIRRVKLPDNLDELVYIELQACER